MPKYPSVYARDSFWLTAQREDLRRLVRQTRVVADYHRTMVALAEDLGNAKKRPAFYRAAEIKIEEGPLRDATR